METQMVPPDPRHDRSLSFFLEFSLAEDDDDWPDDLVYITLA